jgi:hypothetical protein
MLRFARASTVLSAFVAAGSLLAAQYAESSARVLFEQSLGPASNLFGWAATGIGDVNGDGTVDLAVSAPFRSNSGGRVYALSGADGTVLWDRTEFTASTIMGYALETMDWDADGTLDVVAGAPFANVGRVQVFDGVTGATLATLFGQANGDGFGASLATGGDFDGDGVEDLLVAAPFLDLPGRAVAGRVFVYRRGALTQFTVIDGPYANAEFGTGLAFVGDIDQPADGRDELVVGARNSTSFFDGYAAVYTWSGASADFVHYVSGVGMGYSLLGNRISGGADLSGDGVPDFAVGDLFASEVKVFSGGGALLHILDGDGDDAGFGAPRVIPDFDGDGLSDLVVGAWQSSSGADDGGKVFVYSGATGTILKTITAQTPEQNLGIDARAIEDFDGDGRVDLVVGSYGDGFSGSLAGGVTVFGGNLPAVANVLGPAELPTDPQLLDLGGDPSTGPLIGSPLELVDFGIDCSGAPTSGPYAIQIRQTRLSPPLATPFGTLWTSGALLHTCAGMHARDLRRCFPAGVMVPANAALVGLTYTAQGACNARLSSALTQTIGG